MLKTKIAVFVSGGGTNLQALIDAQKSGILQSGEIALVLASNHKAYALTRAAENNIPSAVVVRKEFDSQLAYEEKVKEVLKEYEGLITIFILGDMDKKIERIKRIHEMTDKEAAELIEKQSKKRKAYHNYFCETKWGDSRNYELSINSSKLGEDATTDMLEDYIKRRIQ